MNIIKKGFVMVLFQILIFVLFGFLIYEALSFLMRELRKEE